MSAGSARLQTPHANQPLGSWIDIDFRRLSLRFTLRLHPVPDKYLANLVARSCRATALCCKHVCLLLAIAPIAQRSMSMQVRCQFPNSSLCMSNAHSTSLSYDRCSFHLFHSLCNCKANSYRQPAIYSYPRISKGLIPPCHVNLGTPTTCGRATDRRRHARNQTAQALL